MSSKLTRKLLKASETDLVQVQPLGGSGTNKNNKNSSSNKKRKTDSNETTSATTTDDDLLKWHIRSIQHTDHRISTNEPDNGIKSLKTKHKKQRTHPAKQLYNNLESSIVKERKQQKSIQIHNVLRGGSSRSVPVQAFTKHLPTYNKQKDAKEKQEMEHTKLAKKLQLLDQMKKKEKKNEN